MNQTLKTRETGSTHLRGKKANVATAPHTVQSNHGYLRVTGRGLLQPKLAIGQANDAYEQEADSVAEQVMRMPDSQVLRRKSDEYDQSSALVQRKATGEVAGAEAPPIVHEVLRSPGQPLDRATRAFFEPRFGQDFSHVRIHTGAKAAESARAVGALAYTVGRDVVMGVNHFGSLSGNDHRLVAHELAHTIQQSHGTPTRIQRHMQSKYPWEGVVTSLADAHLRYPAAGAVVGTVPSKTRLTVMGAEQFWLHVRVFLVDKQHIGYISQELVNLSTTDITTDEMSDMAKSGQKFTWTKSGSYGSGPGDNNFQAWAGASTEGSAPSKNSATRLNCWEAVLLSAYRSGTISWVWIHWMYTSKRANYVQLNAPPAMSPEFMSSGAAQTYAPPKSTMPQRGDVVFFNNLAHVALATGNGSDVLSFWPAHDRNSFTTGTEATVEVVSIEKLAAYMNNNGMGPVVVKFAHPSW